MADDLPGSYEHAPPNLIELASRDRRWCQGNLQHTRLLATSGLHPLSRLHLFMGVMSYLASPLWLLFLLSGMALALHAYLVPPDYFLDRWSLFPDWPRIDPERAMALFGICMLVLYAPKLFGTAAFLRSRDSRGLRGRTRLRLPGRADPLGAGRADHDAGADQLGGADPDRPRQRLERPGPRQRAGALAAALALPPPAHARRRACSRSPPGAISWRLLAWMSPAILGLVLAVPLSAFMGSAAAGRWLARMGLLLTPEERTPPPLAGGRRRARPRCSAPAAGCRTGSPGSWPIPAALARHLAWLDGADRAAAGRARRRARRRARSSSPTACRSTGSTPARPSRCSPRPDARRPRAAPVGAAPQVKYL